MYHRWLYAFLVAIDANFKLKLKSHGYKDVELAAGYAYFVCGAPYEAVLAGHKDEAEVCVFIYLSSHPDVLILSRSRHAIQISMLLIMPTHPRALAFPSMESAPLFALATAIF